MFLRIVILGFLLIFQLPAASVRAQETSADFSGGSVKIGPDSRTCVAGLEGNMRYNTTGNIIEYCDGVAWRIL